MIGLREECFDDWGALEGVERSLGAAVLLRESMMRSLFAQITFKSMISCCRLAIFLESLRILASLWRSISILSLSSANSSEGVIRSGSRLNGIGSAESERSGSGWSRALGLVGGNLSGDLGVGVILSLELAFAWGDMFSEFLFLAFLFLSSNIAEKQADEQKDWLVFFGWKVFLQFRQTFSVSGLGGSFPLPADESPILLNE